MTGIFQTDALLKAVLEAAIDDVKQNLWLLDNILADFTDNPFLRTKYGKKQIDAAKEYFTNNGINIFLQFVKDKEKFPAIILTLGSSAEQQELRTMGDVDVENITLLPSQVGQKIPYVVPPFIPVGFDPATGTVTAPVGLDLGPVSAGMVLLNPTNGNGTPVLSVNGQNIMVQADLELDCSQFGIVPQYRYFQSRMGRSYFEENWNITIATNDPQSLLWLHSIVVYTLLRYRSFMEHNGLLETSFTSTDIFNPEFSNAAGEEIYCRQITMKGKVQQQFIRDLHRKIESIVIRDKNPEAVTLEDPSGYVGGIRIVTNNETPPLQQNSQLWHTITETEAEEFETEFED
jgi:hypothetical protein